MVSSCTEVQSRTLLSSLIIQILLPFLLLSLSHAVFQSYQHTSFSPYSSVGPNCGCYASFKLANLRGS
ncbi:hypothetical protein NDU88_009739, partial [Pleurodeles waltl]